MDDPLLWSSTDQERALRVIARWYDLDFGSMTDDVEMILELASGRERVLELGVGSGRIAALLARAGHRVTGVDSSEAMLESGAQRLRESGVNVERGDMRCLDLDERFELVFFGLSTFQHMLRREDQLAALRSARAHLVQEGRLVIDWTAPRPDDLVPTPRALQVEWMRESDDGRWVTKQAMQELALVRECGSALDRSSPIAWITYQYDSVENSGSLHRSLARFPLRVNLSTGEMAGLLAEAGLRAVEWFGSWDFDEPGDGDRLIVVAVGAEEAA
ncbi:MAG: class I SAM-dependent methyltransferase [Chloroflexi bacterium]|nr:class I SAM-dependent methyltransferase [Chloroflexota bacterium]